MKYVFRALVGALALGVVATGCGDSHTSDEDAGEEITFDAGPRVDAGPPMADAGPPAGDIGEPCTSDADCDGTCLTESDYEFPGGYCTADCSTGDECPGGSTCVFLGRSALCLAVCDPDASERSCRSGYGCATSTDVPEPVCFPGCTDDTDCPGDTECDPSGGFYGIEEGACYTPGAEVGDACNVDEDCPSGGFCYSERRSGFPEGTCITFGCDVETNSGCPGDAQCIPGGFGGGGLCFDGCETSDDCREAYECDATDDYPDRMICLGGCTTDDDCTGSRVCNPALGTCDDAFDPGDLGQTCDYRRGGCDGGTCLPEYQSGFPGAYCTYQGCDPTLADGDGGADGCPGNGVCMDAGTHGVCLDGCTEEAECRADYDCKPSDPTDGDSPTACLPACESDAACANDGYQCNVGTGLCRPAFDTDQIGEPCNEGTEACAGAICLSEEAEGWPAGTCAYPGCRLSGDGPAVDCPTDTVCVDDGEGDPTLGVCLDACDTTSDPSDCRVGYACVADGGGTAGSCQPACEGDGDCGGGRTCNTGTGLCE